MNACTNPPSPAAPPHDDGCLESQASPVLAIPSTHNFPSDPSALQIEGNILALGHSENGLQGSGDARLRNALDGPHHDHLQLGSSGTVVPTQRSGLSRENYRRTIQIVTTNRRGNQGMGGIWRATFDTGSPSHNIISSTVVDYLALELQKPGSRRSQILDILLPWRRKSHLCGVNGESIHHEGKVTIRWYCDDTTTYDKQALWFCPTKSYITEHYVVENASADVLFSLSTWDELGLRESPVAIITRKSQPDMSKANIEKVAADAAKQTALRIEKKTKSAIATMQAYKTKKAAKAASSSSTANASSSTGNGASSTDNGASSTGNGASSAGNGSSSNTNGA